MNAPSALMPRPSILSIEPYVGGESKIPGVNRIIKLSSNEGAFGPPPAAVEAMAAAAREMHRYPDGGALRLRQAIGAKFGLDPARIVCGNGSDELLAYLILAYGGEGTELIMSAHGFVMYDLTGRYAGCRVIKVAERNLLADVDGILAAVGPRTRIVCLANPNNPTGALLPDAEVRRLRAGLRDDILLVLDAAYAEYVTEPGFDARRQAGGQRAGHGDDAHILQGVRHGRRAARLAYMPASIADILNGCAGPST
jgi:histidinol-phosphate aminotransferase